MNFHIASFLSSDGATTIGIIALLAIATLARFVILRPLCRPTATTDETETPVLEIVGNQHI